MCLIFYIILIIGIKCNRFIKDWERYLVCGVKLMGFGKIFKEELIFKLIFENIIRFLFGWEWNVKKKDNECICKIYNVVIWGRYKEV